MKQKPNSKEEGTMETDRTIDERIDAGPRSELFSDEERRGRVKRLERNRAARERNAALRELCGTSATAARRDMGI